MKVSHEVPLCLMEESRSFNDYDYALVHLFDKYPNYYQFFKDSLGMNREVILDNSLYELGESFDANKYYQWIKDLKPTYYIVPDTFWNSKRTIQQFNDWMDRYGREIKDLGIKCLAVAQGSTIDNVTDCYNIYKESGLVDKIGFTFKFHPNMAQSIFDDEFIKYMDKNLNDATRNANIRLKLLEELYKREVIGDIPIHLLGMQNTFGLNELSQVTFIDSIDTSNPVMFGWEYNEYDKDGNCLSEKPKTTVMDVFEDKYNEEQLVKIKNNIDIFKQIIK